MTLKKIIIKNFKSTGKVPIEFNFDKNSLNLIKGNSGNGKTLIFEALCYGLFNTSSVHKGNSKATEPINKLINDVNKKELYVEVHIDDYIIKRGVKPNIFEIIKGNENLANKSSKTIDQDYLEKDVLKGLTYNIFMTQNFLCNKTSSVPFLYQSNTNRKNYIESILDIRKIHYLNEALKDEVRKNDLDYKTKLKEIELLENSISNEENNVNSLKQKQKERENEILTYEETREKFIKETNSKIQEINSTKLDRYTKIKDEKTSEINNIKEDINALTKEVLLLKEKLEYLKNDIKVKKEEIDKSDLNKTQLLLNQNKTSLDKLKEKMLSSKLEKEQYLKQKEKFHLCGDCPKVSNFVQNIDLDLFNKAQDKDVITFKNYNKNIDSLEHKIENISKEEAKLNEWINEYKDISTSIKLKENSLLSKENNLISINNSLKESVLKEKEIIENELYNLENLINIKMNETSPSVIEVDVKYLTKLKDDHDKLNTEKDELYNQKSELKIMKEIINDKSLKKRLLQSYLPLFENKLNEILEKFYQEYEFTLKVKLEQDFDLLFLKNNKEISYSILSSGQKELLSLALTFSFLYLVNLKHKNSINVLLVDELLDQSLGTNKIYVLEYLKELSKDNNINIISHDQNIPLELFDKVLEVKKVGVFSKYIEN